MRKLILRILCDEYLDAPRGGHFTAPDALVRLRKKIPKISKATLYRVLPTLVESGVLKTGPRNLDGLPQFEFEGGGEHHDHIVCADCSAIFEFHSDLVEREQMKLTQKLGFSIESHTHSLTVRCELLKQKITSHRR